MFLVTRLPLRVAGEIKAVLCRSPALWFGTEGCRRGGGREGWREGGRGVVPQLPALFRLFKC